MARRVLGLMILVAAFVGASPVSGAPPASGVVDRVVVPTGQWPTDVQNVQAAVDLGGTVLLKAVNAAGQPTAFNFGTPEFLPGRTVFLEAGVQILGESPGTVQTTIRGGDIPFFGVAPVRTRIEGIHFDGPLTSAIIIISSTGSDIINNRVSRVAPFVLDFGDFVATEARGIKFLGNNDPDGAIAGRVRVIGNIVEDLRADFSEAIVFDAVAADVEIRGNHVRNVLAGGLLLIDSKGRVTIEDNVIVPGAGDPGVEAFGNGMTIIRSRGASYVIRRNLLLCENPFADGIIMFGASSVIESAVIQQNDITMRESLFGAISLGGRVANALVSQNRIAGTGAFAIDTFGSPTRPVQSPTFQGNNIAQFDASVADVFLDDFTQGAIFVGHGGTVIDLGVDNRVTGLTSMGGAGLGQQLRDALDRKHAVLDSALP